MDGGDTEPGRSDGKKKTKNEVRQALGNERKPWWKSYVARLNTS
jgi:hypothetical protein